MFYSIRTKISTHTSYPWLIFISVSTAAFMSNIDASVLNVAIPTLEAHFNVGNQQVQWVILSYLLIITGILPLVGKLSDLLGRKIIFVIGLGVFVLGSVLSALSLSIVQLIIFRAIQGIGGAIMQGNVMSIVANTFPKGSRGKALGAIGSIVAIGTIVGPSLGSFLIKYFSWRSIFWINLPIGLLGIIGCLILLPHDTKEKEDHTLDYLGAVLFFVSTTSLLLYLSNGKTWGFDSLIEILLLITALIIGSIVYLAGIKSEASIN